MPFDFYREKFIYFIPVCSRKTEVSDEVLWLIKIFTCYKIFYFTHVLFIIFEIMTLHLGSCLLQRQFEYFNWKFSFSPSGSYLHHLLSYEMWVHLPVSIPVSFFCLIFSLVSFFTHFFSWTPLFFWKLFSSQSSKHFFHFLLTGVHLFS